MSSLTDKQRSIVDTTAENPGHSVSEIAEETGASKSWIRETLADYGDRVFGENNLSGLTVEVCFHRPNGVFFDEETLSQFDFSLGDPVTLELHSSGVDTVRTFGKAESVSKLDTEAETHNRVYAAWEASEETLDELGWVQPEFNLSTDEAGQYTSTYHDNIINIISSFTEADLSGADIVVGVNYLNRVDEEYRPGSINLPAVSVTDEDVVTAFGQSPTALVDVRSLDADIKVTTPDCVYFIRNTEEVSEKLREQIFERELFDFQYHREFGQNSVLSGPYTAPAEGRLIRVSEDNISIQAEKFKYILLKNNSGGYSDWAAAIQNVSLSLGTEGEEHQRIEPEVFTLDNQDGFRFEFGSLPVVVILGDRFAEIFYISESEILTKIADEIVAHITEGTGILVHSRILENSRTFTSDTVVLDTNILYNNRRDESGESLLGLFLDNLRLYKTRFVLPWTVLYELNKHKDRGGPGPQVQDQGIDNLQLLKQLAERGFVRFDTQDLPDQIESRITESDVADMNVVQCAADEDAVLLTGDERLREVAEPFGIKTMPMGDFIEITPSVDVEEDVREEVLPKIKGDIKTEDEVVGAIEEAIEDADKPTERLVEEDTEPSQFFERMQNDREVIPVVDGASDGEETRLVYERADIVEVVVTPSAVSVICNQLEKHDGDKYLPEPFLQEISIPGVQSSHLPYLHFHVPLSSVIGPQSASLRGLSRTAREFYKLKHIENASYSSAEISDATTREEHIHDAVLLARQRDIPLLYAEDDYLEKVSGLLGVRTVECK